MENKDTNTDYQKVVRVGEEKREFEEITLRIVFFFEILLHYFLYWEFWSLTWKKSPPPKVPIPNLTKFPPIQTSKMAQLRPKKTFQKISQDSSIAPKLYQWFWKNLLVSTKEVSTFLHPKIITVWERINHDQ